MKKMYALSFILFCFRAMAQEPAESEKQTIQESINKLFLALEKKDTILYNSVVLPAGQIWTVRRQNDTLKTSMRYFSADKVVLIKMNRVIEERPLRYDITIHNDIAIAWVPYTLSLSGTFSHCGVDVFTLLKSDQGWKIISLAYSVEPQGCDSLKK